MRHDHEAESASPSAPEHESTIADRYELHEELGRDREGRVFRATDRALGREVAVSLVPAATERSSREARARAALNHPVFPRVFDTGETGAWSYLVAELPEGETLEELVARRGPLDPHQALPLAHQIAEALALAQQSGIEVGHVTLSNVVVTAEGHPKLVGFDSTVKPHERAANDGSDRGRSTGRHKHGAPEGALDGRSAVYCLGALLYTLLTGGPPDRAQVVSSRRKIVASGVEPPSTFNSHTWPALDRTILRALESNPERSFKSVAQFADALRTAESAELEETRPIRATAQGERLDRPRATSAPARRRSQDGDAPTLARERSRTSGIPPKVLATLGVIALLSMALWALRPWYAPAPFCPRGTAPRLEGALQQLESKLGSGVVGSPTECAHPNEANGDVLQATERGLAFLRKAANGAPYFMNGHDHWALTPRGLLFWTGEAVDPPRDAETVEGLPGAVRPR